MIGETEAAIPPAASRRAPRAGGVILAVDQGFGERARPAVRVFEDAGIPGIGSEEAVAAALAKSRNILAELAGLYHALSLVAVRHRPHARVRLQGVGLWMQRRWRTKAATVAAVVGACRELVTGRHLKVTYRHQQGHQSSWAGRDDCAHWNRRADALATEGGRPAT